MPLILEGVQFTGTEQNSEVGKKSGPVLNHLWTKVHEIFGQCRRPFVLFSALARLSMLCFVYNIFAIKSKSSNNRTNVTISWSPFFLTGRP